MSDRNMPGNSNQVTIGVLPPSDNFPQALFSINLVQIVEAALIRQHGVERNQKGDSICQVSWKGIHILFGESDRSVVIRYNLKRRQIFGRTDHPKVLPNNRATKFKWLRTSASSLEYAGKRKDKIWILLLSYILSLKRKW